MRLFYTLLFLCLQFSHYDFYSKYLKSFTCQSDYTPLCKWEYPTRQIFVQVFSPLTSIQEIDVKVQNLQFKNVFQVGFITSNHDVQIRCVGNPYIIVWFRVIELNDTINQNSASNSLDWQITGMKNESYTSINTNASRVFSKFPEFYEFWTVPIFPSGQIQNWSSDYSPNMDSLIISALNLSIDDDYLQKNGVLLTKDTIYNYETINLKLVNRNLYTYLIIAQFTVNEKKIQLIPAIIYGCVSKSVFSSTDNTNSQNILNPNTSCKPAMSAVWFNITCAALAFIILFILLGYLSEGTQIFLSSWIITAYFSCIGYHYLIGNIYESDKYLYVILFAMGIGCAIAFTSIFTLSFKKGNNLRMFFNACCVIQIILSIVFFGLENHFPWELYVYIGIGVISLLLLIFLLVCKGFTLTFGSTFIGISLMCLGFSLLIVDSSAIPFLFSDFFNYILNKNLQIMYFSFFLKNDIIILSFWGFLTLFIGMLTYASWRKSNSKNQKRIVEPLQMSPVDRMPSTDNIEINVFTNTLENLNVASTFTRPPPAYTSIDRHNTRFNENPTAPPINIEPPLFNELR